MVASEGRELKLADVMAQVQVMSVWVSRAAKDGKARTWSNGSCFAA